MDKKELLEMIAKKLMDIEVIIEKSNDFFFKNKTGTPEAVDEMITELQDTVSEMQWREVVNSL
jgi:hypothetical protein